MDVRTLSGSFQTKEFAQEIGKHMHVVLFTNVALAHAAEEPQCSVNAAKMCLVTINSFFPLKTLTIL